MEEKMTTITNDIVNQEARAHNELVRLVERYPSTQATYDQVLQKLHEVQQLNLKMDRDEQYEPDRTLIVKV
jgi:hypothetical protein